MKRNTGLLLTLLLSLVLTACGGNKKDSGTDVNTSDIPDQVNTGEDSNAFGTGYSKSYLESLGIFGDPLDEKVVYFEYNSSSMDERSRIIVEAHARFLGNNSGRTVSLAGHADERGTRDYNLALGERRANTVSDWMNSKGAASNIQTISYGEERPADSSHNDAAWQKNRRVEISY